MFNHSLKVFTNHLTSYKTIVNYFIKSNYNCQMLMELKPTTTGNDTPLLSPMSFVDSSPLPTPPPPSPPRPYTYV